MDVVAEQKLIADRNDILSHTIVCRGDSLCRNQFRRNRSKDFPAFFVQQIDAVAKLAGISLQTIPDDFIRSALKLRFVGRSRSADGIIRFELFWDVGHVQCKVGMLVSREDAEARRNVC